MKKQTKIKESIPVGNIIKKVTKATGIKKAVKMFTPDGKDCGCEKREKKLNKIWSYKLKVRCLTETEYNDWKNFTNVRTLKITPEQTDFICNLYGSVFNKPIYKPKTNASHKPVIKMIERLDKVFEAYNNN